MKLPKSTQEIQSDTEDFRDEIKEFMVRNDERWRFTEVFIQDTREAIASGKACVAGAMHATEINTLKSENEKQWKVINAVKRPARKAMVWTAGGLTGLYGLVELAKVIWQAWHGGGQ
jgi:hypothetical protein